jgi:hypothetical protein
MDNKMLAYGQRKTPLKNKKKTLSYIDGQERTLEVARGSGVDIEVRLEDRNIRSLWFSRQELASRQEYIWSCGR